jgi:competence protein ComEA
MKPWQILLTGVLFGLLATGAILLLARPQQGQPILLSPLPTATTTTFPKPTATFPPIQVLIKGQVASPGVYFVAKESRLADLINLAGGLTDKADVSRVNDVFELRDGDYFYIPSFGEIIPETARNAPGNNPLDDPNYFDYPLDINTASQEALESLPGIGPTKAADIITYREESGGFVSIDDLLNVPGIGKATLDAIRDYIIIQQ